MSKKEYISIGELAKLANTTVRTLQYYDKEDIIKPSMLSEGGRRLYTLKDLSVIHQVITLKSLGMSLKEIKRYLIKVETNQDLIQVLEQQSAIIKRQVSKLTKLGDSIEMLRSNITTAKDVDWEKYGKMLSLAQDDNEYYWVINFLDKDLLKNIEQIHSNQDDNVNPASWLKDILIEAVVLSKKGISPTGKEGMDLALRWWNHVEEYIDDDINNLNKLFDFYSENSNWPAEFGDIQEKSRDFIEQAIGSFILKNNILETLRGKKE